MPDCEFYYEVPMENELPIAMQTYERARRAYEWGRLSSGLLRAGLLAAITGWVASVWLSLSPWPWL